MKYKELQQFSIIMIFVVLFSAMFLHLSFIGKGATGFAFLDLNPDVDVIVIDVDLINRYGYLTGHNDVTKREDNLFDVTLSSSPGIPDLVHVDELPEAIVEIKGIDNHNQSMEFKAVIDTLDIDDLEYGLIKTAIFAADSVDMDNAAITLPKTGFVDSILKCDNFDIDHFKCSDSNGWYDADISFSDNGDTITFAVDSFAGYAGSGADVSNNSSLAVWNNADSNVFHGGIDAYANDTIEFFANYSMENGSSIGAEFDGTGVACIINFSDGNSDIMGFIGAYQLYSYERAFEEAGSFTYNVTCDGKLLSYNNTSMDSNLIQIKDIIIESINENETLIQYGAEIGKPVKWKKIIKNISSSNFVFNLPEKAESIDIQKVKNNKKSNIKYQNLGVNLIDLTDEDIVLEEKIESIDAELIKSINKEQDNNMKNEENNYNTQNNSMGNAITGLVTAAFYNNPNFDSDVNINNSIAGDISYNQNTAEKAFNWIINLFKHGITGMTVKKSNDNTEKNTNIKIKKKQIMVKETAEEIEIEYETEAPQIKEQKINDFKKKVVISGPDDVYYQDVLSYTNITELVHVGNENAIKLYLIVNNTKLLVSNIEYIDQDNNNYIDMIRWVVPYLSNQTYEIEIVILNVQSYPTVGGNWTVEFNTTGIANLTITASNGTLWSNENESYDLKFLNLTCGGEFVNYTWVDFGYNGSLNRSVFVENYSCDEATSYETSSVHTAGEHHIEFTFGNYTIYANNDATNPPVVTEFMLNTTNIASNDSNQNLTVNISYSDADGDTVKPIYNWLVNGTSIALLNMPFEKINNTDTNNSHDYSGKDHHGTDTGNIVWNATGGFDGNGSYEFDSIDGYIKLPNTASLHPANEFTISTWVKYKDEGGYVFMIDGISVGLSITSDLAKLDVKANGYEELYSVGVLSENQWYHIAATYDGARQKIYINGLLNSSSDQNGSITYTDNGVSIGYYYGSATYFNGSIDDVVFYNKSLSPEQILALYENKTDIIVADETNIGDNWSVEVTPNDGTVDGVKSLSNNVTIIENIVPIISSVVVNTTDTTNNDTNQNVTAYVTTSDANGDTVKPIYNWLANGTSIALLNMPFEKINNTDTNNSHDYSGKDHHGTDTGDVVWNATGGFDGNGSYEFDGIDGYISVTDSNDFDFANKDITLSVWFKVPNLGVVSNYMIDHQIGGTPGKGWQIRVYSSSFHINHRASIDSIDLYGGSSLNDNQWHLGVITIDSNTKLCKIYVDGIYKNQDSFDGLIDQNEPLGIGTIDLGIWGLYYNGSIDEINIWNRTLSPEQILALYENKTDIIVADETNIGDNWSVEVTPNDGSSDGVKSLSNNVTILQSNAPSASSVVIDNSAASVTLGGSGQPTEVKCYATIIDAGGCSNIDNVYGFLYKSNLSSSYLSLENASNLYANQSCVVDTQVNPCDGGVDTSAIYNCTFQVYQFAEPTDAGSKYENTNWTCSIIPENSVDNGTEANDTIEMESLLSFDFNSSINFGTLSLGDIVENITTIVNNTGNTILDFTLDAYGAADGDNTSFVCTNGNLSLSRLKYNLTGPFEYGDNEYVSNITDSAVEIDADIQKYEGSIAGVFNWPASTLYWGLGAPSSGAGGECSGHVNILAVSDPFED
ncbi:MAG: LamG domain-containing protein [Candidatus Woesearchaeota archaeon]